MPESVRVGTALAASWAAWWWGIPAAFRLLRWLLAATRTGARAWLFDLLNHCQFNLEGTLFAALIGATLAVVAGALVRTVARARLRAGYADPLEQVRAWTAQHAKATRAMLSAPAGAWLATATLMMVLDAWSWGNSAMYGEYAATAWIARMHLLFAIGMGAFWCLSAPLALGIRAATRAGLRSLLAPTVAREQERGRNVADVDDRLHFDAVAVTAETRAAVAAVAVLPVVTVLGIGAGRLGDGATMAALAGYAAVALGSVVAFRRASRIAVGVDGVFVTGSSRTRFYAYSDIDEVRARTGELELLRQGKAVLRLQLHGKDAECRDALLQRLQDAVRAAHERAGAATAEVVASVSSSELARSAAEPCVQVSGRTVPVVSFSM